MAALAVALGCLGPGLALAPQAAADGTAEVSIMDDQLLLGASKAKVDAQMRIFNRLGVDRLRVSAFWSQIAPRAKSRVKPAGFNATNPFDPRYNWVALDRVLRSAIEHRLAIMVSISTPIPYWGSASPGRRNDAWKPKAGDFADFAQAVATRYGPYIDRFAISNEPNQPQWLQPQTERGRLAAPHIYRRMVQAAYPRIKSADPRALVLIGELAAHGSRAFGVRRPIAPLRFLRTMGCRNRRYRRMRSGPCRGFRAVPGDAIGHHPYQLFFEPSVNSLKRDDAQLGDGLRLLRVVDALQRRRALRRGGGGRFNLHYTEFGYQTNPPDPTAGIRPGLQRSYLQKAAYIVWRTPRIKEINQFRLTDGRLSGRGRRRFVEFQSGLLFASRRRKPAFGVFAHPFVISGNRFWGQVRRGTGPYNVVVQRRAGGRWSTVMTVLVSDRRGYFSRVLPGRRPGLYRYRYSGNGVAGTSGAVRAR